MAQVQYGAFQYAAVYYYPCEINVSALYTQHVPMKSRPVRAVIQKEDTLLDLRSDWYNRLTLNRAAVISSQALQLQHY